MRMLQRAAITAAAALLGGLAVPGAARAADYPTTPFFAHGSGGETSGGFVWYNQDVRVQGSVTDFAGGWGSTVAIFEFLQGPRGGPLVPLGSETRSVSGDKRSFNWVQPAPAGGITEIWVTVCNRETSSCGDTAMVRRP